MTAAIPHDRLRRLIDEATAIPTIRLVVFTGGECFLLRHVLDELIARATGHGFSTRCVTNGYWATSPTTASARMKRCVDAGLKEINFSTGTFHSQYVPTRRVVLGAIAAAEAGLVTVINIETFRESQFDDLPILQNPQLDKWRKAGRVLIQRNFWIDNQGAAPLSHEERYSRFHPDRIEGCKTALNVIAVTPTQQLIACCGLHMERIPDLAIGSIMEKTLSEAISVAPDDFLKIWIHVAGPERILQFVKKYLPTYSLPLTSPHPCETCLHLYSDNAALDVIRMHYKEVEDEIVRLYAAGIAQNHIQAAIAVAANDQPRPGTGEI